MSRYLQRCEGQRPDVQVLAFVTVFVRLPGAHSKGMQSMQNCLPPGSQHRCLPHLFSPLLSDYFGVQSLVSLLSMRLCPKQHLDQSMMTYKWFVRKQVSSASLLHTITPFHQQSSLPRTELGSNLVERCRAPVQAGKECRRIDFARMQASHFPGIVFPNQVYNPYTDDGCLCMRVNSYFLDPPLFCNHDRTAKCLSKCAAKPVTYATAPFACRTHW